MPVAAVNHSHLRTTIPGAACALPTRVQVQPLCGSGGRSWRVAHAATTPAAELVSSQGSNDKVAVVVGAGPCGLSAAMMLARRGWQVNLVEKNTNVLYADADKSYVYMIDGRGRKFLSQVPGLCEALPRYGVHTANTQLAIIQPDGSTKSMKPPTWPTARKNHWLPRAAFLQMLVEEGLKGSDATQQGWGTRVRIFTGVCALALHREQQQQQQQQQQQPSGQTALVGQQQRAAAQLKVSFETQDGSTVVLRPRLVVGADGINSAVRATLAEWDTADQRARAGGAAQAATRSRFDLQAFSSPAAGLRYKVLQLPANPVMSTAPGAQPTPNSSFASVRGRPGHANRYIKLGLLPIKDTAQGRTANLITRPEGHELWQIHDAEGLYRYFERELPQVPIRQLVPEAEAQRFAASRGGRFPAPQVVNGLQYTLPANAGPQQYTSSSGSSEALDACGVVLLGDARASFPPDLGQGVNSALEDVVVLEQALAQTGDQVAAALPLYESRRLPDVKALISLMTFAGPHQYGLYKLGSMLWAANAMIRSLAHKLAPQWFTPLAFMEIGDTSLSYQQVLQRAHRTTQRLVGLALAVLLAVGAVVARVLGVLPALPLPALG